MNSLMSPEFSRLMDSLSKKKPENDAERDIQECIRLIMALARKYVRDRVEYEDLVMQSVYRVLKARDKYKESKSGSFVTYAYTCIMREMHAFCRNNSNVLYVPAHIEKAVPSLESILKILSSSYDSSLVMSDNLRIALNYETDLENELPTYILEKILVYKKRILSIAENSCVTYEILAHAAYSAMNSSITVQDTGGKADNELITSSVEVSVGEKEVQNLLKESLGEKRYLALEMHYAGYSNQDISERLHEEGYSGPTGRPITRSAIRSIIDNAMESISKMEVFQKDGFKR